LFPIKQHELEAALRRHVIDVWYPRCVDSERGGFLCDFDRKWKSCGPNDKLLEFQARQAWFAAAALKVMPESAMLRNAALHGLRYLEDQAVDKEAGGWFHRLNRAGEPLEYAIKHTHGIAYLIAAASTIADVLDEPSALELARSAFEWLDTHAHDASCGGYFGLLGRDGQVIHESDQAIWPEQVDPIGTPVGCKDANIQNDLVEAFSLLYSVWPDERVAERLNELMDFIGQEMTGPAGELRYFALGRDNPLAEYVQYGHCFQTSYRVMQARALLGDQQRGIEEGRRWLDYALIAGRDEVNGGFYHSNFTAPAAPKATSKQWWVQLEGFHALADMVVMRPEEDYLHQELRKIWDYINKFVFDHRYGGVFFEPLDQLPIWRRVALGRLAPRDMIRKGSEWKYVGHEGNALLAALSQVPSASS
jgi:mannobiose 2-epimerase